MIDLLVDEGMVDLEAEDRRGHEIEQASHTSGLRAMFSPYPVRWSRIGQFSIPMRTERSSAYRTAA